MPELINTEPLRDQRTMVYVTHPDAAWTSTEEVEDAWQRWADDHGLAIRRRQGDLATDLRESSKTIAVYISGGKWIGDCPDCNGGVPAWPYHGRGCCLDCGTIFKLTYPAKAEMAEIVQIMQERAERDRNYWPHKGETLEVLRVEHGNYVNPDQAEIVAPTIEVATLRDVLTAREFAKLEKAGLV